MDKESLNQRYPYETSFRVEERIKLATSLSHKKDGSMGGIFVISIIDNVATARFRNEQAARIYIKKYNRILNRVKALDKAKG